MTVTFRSQLPISITTILREYPFPNNPHIDIIRKVVQCETDIFFYGIPITDQLPLTTTTALLSARLSGQTVMIIVRTSEQAKTIFNYINSNEENQLAINSKKTLAGIRIASTFSKFKGNSQPLASNKIVITSYSTLFRNLLYRKSREDSLKAKIQLPNVDSYIFVDPFDENRYLNKANKSWTFNDIDSLLSLLPKREKTNIRKYFISTGFIPIEDIKKGFTDIVFSLSEIDRSIYLDLKDDNLYEVILRFTLISLYSGSPSKKEIIERILKTSYIRLYKAEKKITTTEMKQLLKEIIFSSENRQKFSLFESLQVEFLGPFALIRKEPSSYSRYTLTKFGRQYLIASTYFGEMLNNPIEIITNIRKKTKNEKIDWKITQEIFIDFTKGQLQFEDLQLLVSKKNISKEEKETIAKILSSAKISYLVFQVTQMLNCFRERMTQDTRENLNTLNKVLQNSNDFEDTPTIGKKDRQTLERALKELLVNADYPITFHKICSMLIINDYEAKQAIQDLIKNGFQVNKLTIKPPKGRSLDYFTCKDFPDHFKVVCGDCHWYEKKHCTFWRGAKYIAERKVSSENLIRATETLRSDTVGCMNFRGKENVRIVYTIEEFYETITKSFTGYSSENKEMYVYLCNTCILEGREVVIEDFGTGDKPTQGSKPVSCSVCNTTFKLVQKRKKAR